MRALYCRCGHEPVTILAINHNDFFYNHFPRRLNLGLLQRLVNFGEIKDQENHRQPKNEEQCNKNDRCGVRHRVTTPLKLDFAII